jgi:hypothetical protein
LRRTGAWKAAGNELRVCASSRDIRLNAFITAEPGVNLRLPDHHADAPCTTTFPSGIDVSDEAFAALLGRRFPRANGSRASLNAQATLEETQDTLLGRMIVSVGRRIASAWPARTRLRATLPSTRSLLLRFA